VIFAVSLFPPVNATMETVPTATPVTSPAAVTCAIDVLRLAQAMLAAGIGAPAASFATAESCTVFPTKMFALGGVSSTVVTVIVAGTTTINAESLLPPAEARMVALP
jgi:hypothetical protein